MVAELDLATTPAAPPPQGTTSNLTNPHTEFPVLLATCIIAWFFTVPAVLVRLFTKLRVHGRLQYEDYVLTLALAGLINWCILLLVQPIHKGAHIWDTPVADLPTFAFWSNLIIILYVPSILLAKWAILLQLSRIFSIRPRTGTWWMIRGLIWLATLFYFTVFWFDVFACVPREKIWNPHVPGRCYSVSGVLISTSFFNIVLNCMIIALPLIIIKRLQLEWRKKLTVCAIFAGAGLGGISSVIRAVYSIILASNSDMTYTIFPVAMWAVAEISFMILATTFPTMPLFWVYLRGGRTAARKKIGYADKSLAAQGNRQNSNTNGGSMVQDGPWTPITPTYTESRAGSQDPAPWESIKMPPLPPAVLLSMQQRDSEPPNTAESEATSAGGQTLTRDREVSVTNIV